MVDLALRRAATSVELLLALGAEHGIARERLLTGTGLGVEDLRPVDAEVTAGQELAVVETLVELLDEPPGLGLDAGQRYHLTTYGIWGFALVSSPTLRSAIDVGTRHLALTYALTDVSVTIDGPVTRVAFGDAHLPPPVRQFLVERDAAALRTIHRELAGADARVDAVELRASAPPHEVADRFAAVLGAPVVWGTEVNRIVLPPMLLDAPLPSADARTAALAEAQCRQLLESRRQRVGTAGEVRARLLRTPADPPAMAEVAAERHVTERTLRRQLAAEGTSFRALLDEVREALARELLVAAGLGVEQTAARLGFAEPASFVHAFRRWTGTTPGAFRDARRAGRRTGVESGVS